MIRAILTMFMFVTMFLYGLDREFAREDYVNGKYAENCIFQSNCDYYNEK